jgi:NosR/NirI family transcriptional regulator, nitrous oxide reductase regulator
VIELPVIQPEVDQPKAPPRYAWWMAWATRLYRLGVVVAIVWLIHANATRARVQGDAPVRLGEIQVLLPTAAKFDPDSSERRGLFVLDRDGRRIGYALRTMPEVEGITGYAGWTDTLLVLDADDRVIGISIRRTEDTKEHVFKKVAIDEPFMTRLNGLTWDEVAAREAQAGYDDVAGASLSSMAIANGIRHRFRLAKDAAAAPPVPVRFDWHDAGVVAVLGVACAFTFTRVRRRTWTRRAFQLVLIGYLGFANGQILSQSLMVGWAANGAPWRIAGGLVLLLAGALIVPWATRRQLYCSQICPHGAAQELVGRLSRWRLHVPVSLDRALRWLPPMLIAMVIVVAMVGLAIDPADVEPFVAYQIRLASWISIAIAVGGLALAAFVPMAYCKYGCPTGQVLSFVRSHGKADHFRRQDLGAGALVLFVAVLYQHGTLRMWISG